jgi:hypothetical protein
MLPKQGEVRDRPFVGTAARSVAREEPITESVVSLS